MSAARSFALILAVIGALATPTLAAGRQQENGPGRARPPRSALAPAEVVAMLDAYAVVQAQDALQLNDAQYGNFVTRLKRLQETRRRNQQARNQVIQELRRLAGPNASAPVDDNAIRTNLKTLRELDDRSAAELRRAYDSIDEVLDVPQQARFRIFEETIERRKLDLLMRARQSAAGRRGGTSQDR
jgi:hypothetical protein